MVWGVWTMRNRSLLHCTEWQQKKPSLPIAQLKGGVFDGMFVLGEGEVFLLPAFGIKIVGIINTPFCIHRLC